MQLELIDDLPFITITVAYQDRSVDISKVLIDLSHLDIDFFN
jgi:hypothetical protein